MVVASQGCDQKIYAKNLCKWHYNQRRMNLPAKPLLKDRVKNNKKFCNACRLYISVDNFYIVKESKVKFPFNLPSECISCARIRVNRKSRELFLKRKYNITQEIYLTLLELQNGRCAICKTDSPGSNWQHFAIDHDHKCCPGDKTCGKCIRGLLCNDCNQTLGRTKDSIDILNECINYLEKYVYGNN